MTLYEEQNPKDIEYSQVISEISKFLSNIKDSDVKFIYHGTYNVFTVKDEYIFRIPDRTLRNQKGIQLIKREVEVLQFLNSNMSMSIPEPKFTNYDEKTPMMAYKKLPGISLSRCINELEETCLETIARDVGTFLTQLHSKNLLEKSVGLFKLNDLDFLSYYRNVWEKEYREVKQLAWTSLSNQQRNWLDSLYNSFFSKIQGYTFDPTIIHGDFDTSNILVNPETCELSGIIDFEEASIFDPAADFLFFREGKLFLDVIMDFYEGEIDETFHERMQFLFSRACVPYMIYGVKNNLPSLVDAGLELLSDRMKFFP